MKAILSELAQLKSDSDKKRKLPVMGVGASVLEAYSTSVILLGSAHYQSLSSALSRLVTTTGV